MSKIFNYNLRVWGTEDARLDHDNWAALKLEYLLDSLKGVFGRVLDVGCGGGAYSRGLCHYRSDLTVWGVDIAIGNINYAKLRTSNVHFILGSSYHLPFKNDSFDAVFSIDALEHMKYPEKAIAEMYRVLKPAGILHFAAPLEGSYLSILGFLYRFFGWSPKEKLVGHVARFTYQNLKSMITTAGFEFKKNKYSVHYVIQLLDVLSVALILFFGLNHDPSYSLEKKIVKGPHSIIKDLLLPFYRLMIVFYYCESKYLAWLPGYSVNMTAVK